MKLFPYCNNDGYIYMHLFWMPRLEYHYIPNSFLKKDISGLAAHAGTIYLTG
jgi:hypothetical protein